MFERVQTLKFVAYHIRIENNKRKSILNASQNSSFFFGDMEIFSLCSSLQRNEKKLCKGVIHLVVKKIGVNREYLSPNTFFHRHNNENDASTVIHPSISKPILQFFFCHGLLRFGLVFFFRFFLVVLNLFFRQSLRFGALMRYSEEVLLLLFFFSCLIHSVATHKRTFRRSCIVEAQSTVK